MPESSHDKQARPASRFAGRDGVTAEERDRPPGNDDVIALEQHAAAQQPAQLGLFAVSDAGVFQMPSGGLPELSAHAGLDLARTEFRRHLEAAGRPFNTIESYGYDLGILQDLVGPIPINRIERNDIARFLGDASSKSTRKRRLTSVRQFFRYLIEDVRVLRVDPTEGYYPHHIALRTPIPLFGGEQQTILAAAARDEPWSEIAIWLMLRLGLTRSELLALHRDHIDRTAVEHPVVYIVYEQISKQSKDRRLAGDRTFEHPARSVF